MCLIRCKSLSSPAPSPALTGSLQSTAQLTGSPPVHKETEEETLPPPRVYVRPVSRHSSRRSHPPSSVHIAPRPITPHCSGSRVSASYLERTSQTSHASSHGVSEYILAPARAAAAAPPAYTSPPRIIQAPDPPKANDLTVRVSQPPARRSTEQVIIFDASPRTSRSSVQSGRRLSQRRESRHGRHGSREEKVLVERSRSRGGERRSMSRQYLTATTVQRMSEEPDPVRSPETAREGRPGAPAYETHRSRSRSITYGANPRLSGRVADRQRVVVEEDGRRREYYATKGTS